MPFLICSCSQRLTSSSCPSSRASSSLHSIPEPQHTHTHSKTQRSVCRSGEWGFLSFYINKSFRRQDLSFIHWPISSAIFCLWVLILTPLKTILCSSSSSLPPFSSSWVRRLFAVSFSTSGASPPSSRAICLRLRAAWMKAASGISPVEMHDSYCWCNDFQMNFQRLLNDFSN